VFQKAHFSAALSLILARKFSSVTSSSFSPASRSAYSTGFPGILRFRQSCLMTSATGCNCISSSQQGNEVALPALGRCARAQSNHPWLSQSLSRRVMVDVVVPESAVEDLESQE